jgi:hypothetical protein
METEIEKKIERQRKKIIPFDEKERKNMEVNKEREVYKLRGGRKGKPTRGQTLT